MDGREAIIAKIISDAEKKAKEAVRVSEVYAADVKEQAEEWAKEYSKEREIGLLKETEEIIARRKIVADLDVKKIALKNKQDVIEKIYALAEKKLCALDKKRYLTFVLKKISENADEGDGVVLSCDGVITEKDIAESAVAQKLKLKVEKRRGDFIGGVMLIGKTCDKDLTFREIVRTEKTASSSAYAKKLFGC